jgi:hypothetical protein
MSKKMTLLALAVAALFAIPSAASAQEIHFSGVNSFNVSGGVGTLTATNEPKITCAATSGSGSYNAGSTTTGTITLIFTSCTSEFLGIKGRCSSAGHTAESETITSGGTFHLITFVNSKGEKKPAVLVTPNTTTITCIGVSRVEVTGNGIIGTITSPACGAKSNKMGLSFEAVGSTQTHLEYTSVKYDLSADTENSEGTTTSTTTAALAGTSTIESSNEGTLECT